MSAERCPRCGSFEPTYQRRLCARPATPHSFHSPVADERCPTCSGSGDVSADFGIWAFPRHSDSCRECGATNPPPEPRMPCPDCSSIADGDEPLPHVTEATPIDHPVADGGEGEHAKPVFDRPSERFQHLVDGVADGDYLKDEEKKDAADGEGKEVWGCFDEQGNLIDGHDGPMVPASELTRLRERAQKAVDAFECGRGPWLDPSYMPLAEALDALGKALNPDTQEDT